MGDRPPRGQNQRPDRELRLVIRPENPELIAERRAPGEEPHRLVLLPAHDVEHEAPRAWIGLVDGGVLARSDEEVRVNRERQSAEHDDAQLVPGQHHERSAVAVDRTVVADRPVSLEFSHHEAEAEAGLLLSELRPPHFGERLRFH